MAEQFTADPLPTEEPEMKDAPANRRRTPWIVAVISVSAASAIASVVLFQMSTNVALDTENKLKMVSASEVAAKKKDQLTAVLESCSSLIDQKIRLMDKFEDRLSIVRQETENLYYTNRHNWSRYSEAMLAALPLMTDISDVDLEECNDR
jgi:hypothetical protein